jgi:hypothetical protein
VVLTFGHHDWLAIGEFPDEKAAASAVLAAAAGDSLSDVETTVAMTAKDAAATFESAGKAAREFPERWTLLGSGRAAQTRDGNHGSQRSSCKSPLLALNGHPNERGRCPLLGVKRT